MRNKRGVFGLTSVQMFFTIILAIALLAYVIITIFGTLQTATILPRGTITTAVNNEVGFINQTSYRLSVASSVTTSTDFQIITAINATSGLIITSSNYTLSATGFLTNATSRVWNNVSLNYTYDSDSSSVINANSILSNTSIGITGFFGAINPVYTILAVLVIILVLIVLVRVVTGSQGGSNRESSYSL